MVILMTPDCESVRKAIGIEVTTAQLPDAVIALAIYEGAASLWAKTVDPDVMAKVAGGTDDQKAHITNAVVLKTASLLVKAFPFLEEESFGLGHNFKRAKVDKEVLSDSLASRAYEEMAAYLNTDTTKPSVAFIPAFTVAPGYRGR